MIKLLKKLFKKRKQGTPRFIYTTVHRIRYQCPECGHITDYQTDSKPVSNNCHHCLKPIKFIDLVIDKYE